MEGDFGFKMLTSLVWPAFVGQECWDAYYGPPPETRTVMARGGAIRLTRAIILLAVAPLIIHASITQVEPQNAGRCARWCLFVRTCYATLLIACAFAAMSGRADISVTGLYATPASLHRFRL